MLAARAVICPINTRLTQPEVAYILEHSGAKLVLVDHECVHLARGAKARVVVAEDTGKPGDPYEDFLSAGRKFGAERGWAGLEWEADEDRPMALCYTSGTTGRVSGLWAACAAMVETVVIVAQGRSHDAARYGLALPTKQWYLHSRYRVIPSGHWQCIRDRVGATVSLYCCIRTAELASRMNRDSTYLWYTRSSPHKVVC